MTTVQFLSGLMDWLLADPAHVVTAASALAALTPTPDPASPWGKAYRLVELFALNFLHAKEPGRVAAPVPAPAPAPTIPLAGPPAAALAVLLAGLALAACTSTGQLTPAAQQAVTVACAIDSAVQPVAVPLAAELAPEVAGLASLDQQLLHPAVVAACKAVNGTPASVTVAPAAPAPAAAATAALAAADAPH